MKNPVAYYLLLLYLFALCKPVMPLVQDVAAHTFFEHQHLTAIHQHNGSGHVKDEIGKLAEKSSSDETATGAKMYDAVPLHVATSLVFRFSSTQPVAPSPESYYLSQLSFVSLAIQLPPPRV